MAFTYPVYTVHREGRNDRIYTRGPRRVLGRRQYGFFECEKCFHRWESAWAWEGRGQKCRQCTDREDWHDVEYTDPFELRPLLRRQELEDMYSREGRDWDPNRRRRPPDHYYQNCEYCAELCGSVRRMATRHACMERI